MLRQSISILFNYFLASHFALVEILFSMVKMEEGQSHVA